MSTTARNVSVDMALTNLSIAYKVEGLIGDVVVPNVPVVKDSGKYFEWSKSDDFRNFNGKDLRAPGALSKTIDFSTSTKTYSAEEYALNVFVLDKEKQNADSVLNLEISKTNRLKQSLMIAREARIAAIFTDANNYASTNKTTLSWSSQWNNSSYAGNIVEELDTAKEAVRKQIGRRPNTIIIPEAVADVMKNDSNIIELLKYTKTDMLENGDLPKRIRGMNVIIAGAVSNTAIDGATDSIGDIWGKNVVLAYINTANPTVDDISFVYGFRSQQLTVRKWRDDPKKGDYIEMEYCEDIKVVSNVAAYLIKDCIA